jgi:UDP-N-acetylmuramate dehydrogenase
MTKLDQVRKLLGDTVTGQEPLAKHTTLGIGGPAEYFYEAKTKANLIGAIKVAKKIELPWFILGGGSNIVVSDKGVKGIVIKSLLQDFTVQPFYQAFVPAMIVPRLAQLGEKGHLSASKTEMSFEKSDPRFLATIGSGWKMNALILRCFEENLVGIEWFAGIPGTLGGAVFMNLHGGHHFISEFVYRVESFDPQTQTIVERKNAQLAFDYDRSIFHNRREIILTVDLVLYRGDPDKAREIQQQWLKQKLAVQPQRSCGSVWQNLESKVQEKLSLPTPAIGYVIEHTLGLKGKRIGDAQISPKHAGFIENVGQAKAQDVIELMDLVEQKAEKKLGITLKREVIVIGER